MCDVLNVLISRVAANSYLGIRIGETLPDFLWSNRIVVNRSVVGAFKFLRYIIYYIAYIIDEDSNNHCLQSP